MAIYASPETESFYVDGVHQDVPSDAVEVSIELYDALIDGRARGKDIDFTTLPPSLKDKPEVELTTQQLATLERTWRDGVVSESEWLVSRHRDELDMQLDTTLTAPQFAELLVYRQALRDWPQSVGFPDQSLRPTEPNWVQEQIR
ncbi:hypothetical protein BGP82_12875 [Pseudomonas putida]|uniref:Phage tail assembly chaperone-like domain-containing protein n=1 Tax=Pseudomonas putida TaxID=303 RepID=A0A2S3WLD8_PSEPU|nr:phage tail assembly chaperone [Pseudomonas putida]POG02236.1 hypothetical protein BGP82_12875 [Pseudomonas putida]